MPSHVSLQEGGTEKSQTSQVRDAETESRCFEDAGRGHEPLEKAEAGPCLTFLERAWPY